MKSMLGYGADEYGSVEIALQDPRQLEKVRVELQRRLPAGYVEEGEWFSGGVVAKVTGWSAERTAGVMSGAQEAGLIDFDPEGGKYGWALTEKALELA